MSSPARRQHTFRRSFDGQDVGNLKLSRVIGQTALSNSTIAATASGCVVYAAGCVATVYNPQSNKQVAFFNVSRAISSLCVSDDGRFVALGERGHQPCITVWECATQKQIACLTGHQHGIGSMKFSHDGHYLVSLGFQHDKQLILWHWQDCEMICTHKIENKVHAISFHPSGNFFVTCGDRHLKWWYFVKENGPSGSNPKVVGINGRPASILETQKDSVFVDIACAPPTADRALQSSIYTTTSTGMLCLVHESRLMDKWVQLDNAHSYCLCLTTSLLLVGSSNGKVFIFSPSSLEYLSTLPMPFPLSSSIDVTDFTSYPACYGVCSIPSTSYVWCVYADRSMFFWDILDVLSPAKLRSLVFHRACIWDIQFIEATGSTTEAELPEADSLPLAQGTFATCGADNCIHFWNTDPKQQRKSKWKSRLSRDILHTLDLGTGSGALATGDGRTRGGNTAMPSDLSTAVPDVELPDRQQGNLIGRVLAVHPNGMEIACGDRRGVLHVYDLSDMEPISSVTAQGLPAHEAEILTLDYSPYIPSSTSADGGDKDLVLLASGGRDRLVHIFDASDTAGPNGRYSLVTTLDNHSSSVTVTKFNADGSRLVSCGGDKIMVLNSVKGREVTRVRSIQTPHGTINGIALDTATSKFAISAGQDKRVNVWNMNSGKLMRTYRSEGISGELFKCAMDPSGMYMATCSFDKVIRMYDFFSGDLLAQVSGHSDLITAVRFSPDGRSLYSVGGDGCIMIWDLAEDLVLAMQDRLLELYAAAQRKKQVVDEKARSIVKVRTGGGLLGAETEANAARRPATAAAESTKPLLTPPTHDPSEQRPSTSHVEERGGKKLPASRMPAWAARVDGGKESRMSESVAPVAGKWAARVDPAKIRGGDRNRLTLEMTVEEATWRPPMSPAAQSPASNRVDDMEKSDDVLIERDEDMTVLGSSSDEEEIDLPPLEKDAGGEDGGDDILNKTSASLDELQDAASRLEDWLENKLREEVDLDEEVSTSLKEISHSPGGPSKADSCRRDDDSGRAHLGNSLSSDFFKNVRKNPDSRKEDVYCDVPPLPPPTYSSENEDIVTTDSAADMSALDMSTPSVTRSSSSATDALNAKRQETACAVSQMRERLRAMGILDKTIQPPPPAASEDEEVFAPPPPPASPTASVNPITTHDAVAASDDAGEVSEADTVGGEEDTDNDVNCETSHSNDEEGLDVLPEQEEYRDLLKQLMDVSHRAMAAYNTLLAKKQTAVLASPHKTATRCPALTEVNESTDARIIPQQSHSPMPKIQAGKGNVDTWGDHSRQDSVVAPVDQLLVEFEHGFESIATAAGSLVNQSRTIMRHSAGVSDSFSLIGARQSRVKAVDETGASELSSSNIINDENMSALLYGSATSRSVTSESAADVSAILEKYSDRLVSMVTEKMQASQTK